MKLKIAPSERKYNSVDTGYANIVDTNSWSTKKHSKNKQFFISGGPVRVKFLFIH